MRTLSTELQGGNLQLCGAEVVDQGLRFGALRTCGLIDAGLGLLFPVQRELGNHAPLLFLPGDCDEPVFRNGRKSVLCPRISSTAIIGAMMFLVGIELMKFAGEVRLTKDLIPLAVTILVALIGNMAFGFLAGLGTHYLIRNK